MRIPVMLILVALLGACQPMSIYYRAGVSVAKAEDDKLNCEVAALKDAPVATQIRREPSVFVPPRQICNAAGVCTVRGGYWLPGRTYTVDVNASLRGRLVDRCMAQKGYQPVSIPPCPQSVADAAPGGATRTLPTLTPSSCVIRNPDGSFLIVNRG
ncbi:hypothetical protein [Aestuariivita boseongensis]|uniref:hypothetical protein n=1 Tax=Aestuariivita boseongensis TaxID=1470562 RepID=UPI00067FF6AD|nr:hypothetical protein [Aestuariivita boseongensis]